MTLVFNISGLLILAVLIGIFLRLGRGSRETNAPSGRPSEREKGAGTAKRSR